MKQRITAALCEHCQRRKRHRLLPYRRDRSPRSEWKPVAGARSRSPGNRGRTPCSRYGQICNHRCGKSRGIFPCRRCSPYPCSRISPGKRNKEDIMPSPANKNKQARACEERKYFRGSEARLDIEEIDVKIIQTDNHTAIKQFRGFPEHAEELVDHQTGDNDHIIRCHRDRALRLQRAGENLIEAL